LAEKLPWRDRADDDGVPDSASVGQLHDLHSRKDESDSFCVKDLLITFMVLAEKRGWTHLLPDNIQ
jgi:hypothetical protein